ncbi:hypothetical protein Micbo1qcDRAFT_236313 [Microdochium bolleyi]|uniref:C2H2-type domain-containing protein n=1 Tax=Microdochium bolleyi TaxID=196109 RepID=A0A136ISK5_9PEZI|nr:hypothetical protein Micbo1qcDRAFT_236313 [Microdochium bolleyi]
MYPNAPKSLRLQLSDSILDRHVRIKYRKFRHQRLETDSRQATVFPQEERVRRPATEDNEPRAVTENRQPAAQPVDADFDFATTVDRSQFHKNLKPRPPVLQPTIPGVSATTVVLNDSSAYEPPTPIQDDFQNACCDWCFKPLNFNFFENEGKRWSRFGRSHYRRDLEPFVCLAEKCSQERPSFHSTKDWRAHMRSHTQTWTQTIHCAPRWGCPLSKDTPATAIDPEGLLHMGPVYFSTYDELRSHLGAMHKEAALGIDDELLEHPATTSQRALTECVLCGFVVDHGKETQASKASSHKRDSTMTKSPLPPAKKRNVQWANDSADITLPTRNVEPQLQATEIPIGARVSNEAPMVTLAIASTTTRAFIERGQSIDAGTSAIEDPPLDNLQTQEIMEEHILLHLNNIFQFGLRLMEGEKNVRGATEDGKSVEPDEPVSSAKTRLLSATSAGLPSLNYNSEPELEPPADIAHTATTDGVEISRDQLWHQHFLSVGYDQIPPLESLNSYLDDITGVIEHPGAVGDIPSPNFRMGLSLNEDWSFVPLRDPDASLSHSEIVNTGVNPLDYKHYS